jgi:translation initiation factor 3 subunit I
MKLWKVQNGTCLHTWTFPTAVKRVEFSEDGTKLLAVIEQRMGHAGSVVVYPVDESSAERIVSISKLMAESNEPDLTIPTQDSKATVAGWSFLDRYIIMGHENGMVSQCDAKVNILRCKLIKTGERLEQAQEHQKAMSITDLQFAPDRTYFITASKDKTAKVRPR